MKGFSGHVAAGSFEDGSHFVGQVGKLLIAAWFSRATPSIQAWSKKVRVLYCHDTCIYLESNHVRYFCWFRLLRERWECRFAWKRCALLCLRRCGLGSDFRDAPSCPKCREGASVLKALKIHGINCKVSSPLNSRDCTPCLPSPWQGPLVASAGTWRTWRREGQLENNRALLSLEARNPDHELGQDATLNG